MNNCIGPLLAFRRVCLKYSPSLAPRIQKPISLIECLFLRYLHHHYMFLERFLFQVAWLRVQTEGKGEVGNGIGCFASVHQYIMVK